MRYRGIIPGERRRVLDAAHGGADNGARISDSIHEKDVTLALALKLGGFSLLRSDGVDPVLVMDDVFAELDTSRRDRLTELVADADQVLITAAVPGDVPEALAGSRHLVSDGKIEKIP